MNIMVVDDEKVQVESIMRGLRSRRFNVVEALNGEEAVTRLNDENCHIDMVLTDYAMPGMNGIALLRRIREKDPSLPVIIMTAYGDKDLVIEAMRNACDSFIEKPFTLDTLMNEIDRVMLKAMRKKDSRQLTETVSEFVHQINNPLFSISAGAELALDDLEKNKTDALKDRMSRILKATEKIAEINRGMQNFGCDAREDLEDLDIGALLEDCIEMFDDLLRLKGISVEKKFHGDGVRVHGNRFELEQMFKNLILNAVDAMNQAPEKRLSIGYGPEEGSRSVCVHVEDTGCGISEGSVNRIFEPYFTTRKDGTGLGLAVVKEVVEKHEGTVGVESVAGQGTRFGIMLKITVYHENHLGEKQTPPLPLKTIAVSRDKSYFTVFMPLLANSHTCSML